MYALTYTVTQLQLHSYTVHARPAPCDHPPPVMRPPESSPSTQASSRRPHELGCQAGRGLSGGAVATGQGASWGLAFYTRGSKKRVCGSAGTYAGRDNDSTGTGTCDELGVSWLLGDRIDRKPVSAFGTAVW